MRLARIALRCAYVVGDIRKTAISIIKTAAAGSTGKALEKAYDYLELVRTERAKAEEALELVEQRLNGSNVEDNTPPRRIKDTAQFLGVTIDTLRNWELNGLINVPRNPGNRYRQYGMREINRLKIIRTLRRANYSIMAVLRMILHLDKGETDNFRTVLDTPGPDEDIVYATDKWISTLIETEKNAGDIIEQLKKM